MDMKNFWQSLQTKYFKWPLLALGAVIVLLLVFQLGMFVGLRKAGFSYRWADNYHRNFGGPRGGFMGEFMGDFMGRDFINGHGTVGTVVKVEGSSLVIRGRDNVEKIINLTDKTAINLGRQAAALSDIKVDNGVVVIGSPQDDGSIEAKIIRVFDINNLPSLPSAGLFNQPRR